MLQHSSSGSGEKESTDINALTDGYLRLAYHGLRTKDKTFNASMKTDFDETIGNINIIDNGNGIPQKILDKIFQPFFTTKLTGQGTGLGLSLSYDIIKAHGGSIKADSEEGAGSVFNIQLPLNI